MMDRVAAAMRSLLSARRSVPVLVYHSVGPTNDHPLWGHLTLPVEVFEAQLAWLRREGFRTISLYDLYAFLRNGASLPERPLVLTFDDGFLDNWVYASPLLERYGFQATLFLCPAFVQRETGVRERAAVANGRPEPAEWWGYVRWDEVRALLRSGVFDVQAHGLTHTRYFSGPRIVDFQHPGSPYYWCSWNADAAQQPYWLTRTFVTESDYGRPVYEHAEALLAPRYEPDPDLDTHLHSLVVRHGGPGFFRRPDWRDRLHNAAEAYRRRHGDRGALESRETYLDRVRLELRQCRDILQRQLHHRVDFFCWPVDRYNDEVHALALEAGYLATTCMNRPNVPGADPTRIGRTYFGQSEQSHRIGRPYLVNLKFRGLTQLLSGRRRGYLQIFLANRLAAWHDRHHRPEYGGCPRG